MIDQAMILAAGLGTRMRPLTDELPKPLVQVKGRPMIDHIVDRVQAGGIKKIIVNTHYRAEMMQNHLTGRGVIISHEPKLLDSGGGLKLALPHFAERPFFAINADSLWQDNKENAFQAMIKKYDAAKMDALLLLYPRENSTNVSAMGDVLMNGDGRISFREGATQAPYNYMGIQILHPRLFAGAPEGPFSVRILWQKAVAAGRAYGHLYSGKWWHVGSIDELKAAETSFPSL
ncbi:MAG: nucleotidyltransferase family protein [Dongiaceae bacterium]